MDIYNEGIDIPEVNTVLFLRPTESLTVFLQQLGSGLRLSEGKEALTVLDFVGQAYKKYSFKDRFKALLSRTRKTVEHEIKNGFANVPRGCSIQLEKQAQDYILENISDALYTAIIEKIVIKERTRLVFYLNNGLAFEERYSLKRGRYIL